MSVKGLAVSSAGLVGAHVVESGANKVLEKLPIQKQYKVRGVLMMVGAVLLFRAGLKLFNRV